MRTPADYPACGRSVSHRLHLVLYLPFAYLLNSAFGLRQQQCTHSWYPRRFPSVFLRSGLRSLSIAFLQAGHHLLCLPRDV